MSTFVYTFLLGVLHACRREKKGVKCDSAAKASVHKTYNLFMKAAKFSGAPTEKIVPLIDLGLMSTSEAITKVEEALAHLPGRTSFITQVCATELLGAWYTYDGTHAHTHAHNTSTNNCVHTYVYTMRQQLCTLVAVQNWTVIWHACHGTHIRVHTHTYTHTHILRTHTQTIVYTRMCTQFGNHSVHMFLYTIEQ